MKVTHTVYIYLCYFILHGCHACETCFTHIMMNSRRTKYVVAKIYYIETWVSI